MVDIIEKNGVVNIKNSSGGGILLDGKKPITEDEVINVLNKRYPIGSKYIFPTGSENPASDIGGDWIKVASNLKLSLGLSVGSYIVENGNFIFKNGYNNVLPLVGNAGVNPGMYLDTAGHSIGASNLKYHTGLSSITTLSEENLIIVDVWKRVG